MHNGCCFTVKANLFVFDRIFIKILTHLSLSEGNRRNIQWNKLLIKLVCKDVSSQFFVLIDKKVWKFSRPANSDILRWCFNPERFIKKESQRIQIFFWTIYCRSCWRWFKNRTFLQKFVATRFEFNGFLAVINWIKWEYQTTN